MVLPKSNPFSFSCTRNSKYHEKYVGRFLKERTIRDLFLALFRDTRKELTSKFPSTSVLAIGGKLFVVSEK